MYMNNVDHLNKENESVLNEDSSSPVKKIVIILSLVIIIICIGLAYLVFVKPSNRMGDSNKKYPQTQLTYDSLPTYVVKTPIIKGSGTADQTLCDNETVYKSLADALKETKKVCILALDNQGLSELPSDITKLKDLQFVFLRYNNFTQFPPQLMELSNLRGIDLSNNSITKLPDNFTKLLFLQKIVLSGNDINTAERANVRKALGFREIIF